VIEACRKKSIATACEFFVTAASMTTLHPTPPTLRGIAVFFVGFGIVWTLFIVVVWKFGALPEPARPWLRTAVWLGAVVAWIAWQRPAAPLSWLGVSSLNRRNIAIALVVFAVLVVWNVLRVHLMNSSTGSLSSRPLDSLMWGFIGVFVEEIVFRGVIQTRLSERLAALHAILITSILFLLIHVPGWFILSIPVDAAAIVTVFLVGVIGGVLRWWTKSLWPGVAAHWANNLGAGL
jgi:membrane protease YdiL (CAAX protease family)